MLALTIIRKVYLCLCRHLMVAKVHIAMVAESRTLGEDSYLLLYYSDCCHLGIDIVDRVGRCYSSRNCIFTW
jgi:hypothetical protein